LQRRRAARAHSVTFAPILLLVAECERCEGKVKGHPPRGGVRCGDLTRRGGGVGHPIECLLVKCHSTHKKGVGHPIGRLPLSHSNAPMPNGTHFAMDMDMQSAGQRVESVPSVGEDIDSVCGALCV